MPAFPQPADPSPEAVNAAIRVLTNHQANIAALILPTLRGWCEEHREWIGEGWLQMGTDLQTIEFLVGLLVPAGDDDSRLQDLLSECDLKITKQIGELNYPWPIQLKTCAFRVDETLNSFIQSNHKRASKIFP